MPLKKIPYASLSALFQDSLNFEEEEKTTKLLLAFRIVRKRKYMTKTELLAVCGWKAPRAKAHINKNTSAAVRRITTRAFAGRNEKTRIELLTELKGVSYPMASAILMFYNPQRYGVIDIRVWQLLYAMKAVHSNPSGKAFNTEQWCAFLEIIRFYAKTFGVSARAIEIRLFQVHVQYQKGNLY